MMRIPLGSRPPEAKSSPFELTGFPSANIRGGDLVRPESPPDDLRAAPETAPFPKREWVPTDRIYGTLNVLTGGALNDLRANAAKLVAVKNGSLDKFYHARGHCEAAARGAYQSFWAKQAGQTREIRQLDDKLRKIEKSIVEKLDRANQKFGENKERLATEKERIRQEAKREREFAERDMRDDLAANERGLREGERIRSENGAISAEERERRCREAVADTIPKNESSNSGDAP